MSKYLGYISQQKWISFYTFLLKKAESWEDLLESRAEAGDEYIHTFAGDGGDDFVKRRAVFGWWVMIEGGGNAW